MAGQIAEMEAARHKAVADKARLDWLQQEGIAMWTGHVTRWESFSRRDNDIRAAIDEAMKTERTENGS